MKTMTVGEFKAQFSDVIEQVKAGEKIAVTFGKKKEVIGYFTPEDSDAKVKKKQRPLGPLKHLGYVMADDFCANAEDDFPINDASL
ncbi:type II toxin-antitoxin system Phd/YefM family antitoxin [Dyadobacter luteus]|jgi:antitoxin (DNA-binding transcriptional repressor) of toxin-antitoxin stability system|uniref:type II toxin-antitoxin system Phd/YefM family antitoxin n=1 Tax=Dyadobacter luteus TaxID=2259619 RepID=UPI0018F4A17F|nr:prevent-host-death protein [Dyadobacter luteus]